MTLELILPLVVQGGLAPLAEQRILKPRQAPLPSKCGWFQELVARIPQVKCTTGSNEDGTARWQSNLSHNLFPLTPNANCRKHDEIREFDSIEWT